MQYARVQCASLSICDHRCLRVCGQSCVEAAFLLPVLLVFLLLLLQPALMLYHALILENTCQEACRVLATCSNDQEDRKSVV